MANIAREVALALLLGGCIPPSAVTTPLGIVYLEENPPQWLQEHEQKHWELAQEMGLEYWLKYYSDPEWAYNEEIRAGIDPCEFPETYPFISLRDFCETEDIR